ncbi:MAG: radical SAM protein [Muribaculaceae bacterium]|nr:radical SAM protein [Roseburia sp.]MCM1430756.1 radical SAM protein [Muribaculaceae bacterium]MCM1492735.1 radical SAM protein [Muribaculaceae bacterium]
MNEYLKNVNRIEFVVTMACTGHCRHCSEGEHTQGGEHIDADIAVSAIYDLCRLYKIKSLMTFGGEPLLYPEVVCRIHEAAAKMNIPQRDLITNGFFSKDEKRIREVAHMLAESGVCNILLSVDAFHQETIPLRPVLVFAESVKNEGIGIKLSPAWLVSKEDDNPYNQKTVEILREFKQLAIPAGNGNVIFPSGNAGKYLAEYFDADTEYADPYEEDPADIRTISFAPNGDVLHGNINLDSISGILDAYFP